jgi:hypothetical protein
MPVFPYIRYYSICSSSFIELYNKGYIFFYINYIIPLYYINRVFNI